MSKSQSDKNILIIRNASAHDFGGGERIPIEIALQLSSNGYSVLVLSANKSLLDYARTTGVSAKKSPWLTFQDWQGARNLLIPLYLLWQTYLFFYYLAIFIRHKIDIIHPQSKDDFIAATLAAKVLGRKVVWSDYADLKYIFSNLSTRFKNPIGKVIFRLSRLPEAIIVTSHNDLSLIREAAGKKLSDNYKVIHYGIKDSVVTASARKTSERAIRFCMVSRLVDSKGVPDLLEAFESLPNSLAQSELWLFGEGPDGDKYRETSKSDSRIKFLGYPDDTLEQVAACDIFVHPSHMEGFSISLLEAAKLGLPIIACNVGGNPELISNDKTGILVEPKNPIQLATAMEKLAKDSILRQNLGQAIHKKFQKSFVLEDIVKNEILPLYEK
ncbi:glycosyltransferase family 4 protein [Candidatus Saccharibacteria bacterium]|nr:glycosyltransferase family 4 protein [Candidatus Saccharibacteria bacterium]